MAKALDSNRIIKNSAFLFFRMLLVTAVGFYVSRIVLEALGIDDYGIYNVVGSVIIFLSFFKQALTNATYRFFTYELGAGDINGLNKMFSMSINVHVILALLLFIILEIAGPIFINYKLKIPYDRITAANWVFQLSLLGFCVEIIRTPYNSCVIAHEQMNFYAITSIVEVILKLVIAYILIIADTDKLILYACLLLFVSVILSIWYYGYCKKHFTEATYKQFWDSSLFKKLIHYSGWSILVNAADITVTQSINIFYNLYGGVAVNAALGVANQVSGHVNQFLSNFTQAFNPQIIKSYAQKEYNYFNRLLFSTAKISFFLLFSAAFPVIVFSHFILSIWLVEVPEYSALFICLILIYYLLDSFQSPLWQAVHATGNIRTHQILMSVIKFSTIPIIYIALRMGLPLYSALLVWISTGILCAIVRTIYMHYLIKLNSIKFFLDVYCRTFLAIIIAVPIPLYFYFQHGVGWWQLLIFLVIFEACLMCCAYFIGFNKIERNYVISLIKSKLPHRISSKIFK